MKSFGRDVYNPVLTTVGRPPPRLFRQSLSRLFELRGELSRTLFRPPPSFGAPSHVSWSIKNSRKPLQPTARGQTRSCLAFLVACCILRTRCRRRRWTVSPRQLFFVLTESDRRATWTLRTLSPSRRRIDPEKMASNVVCGIVNKGSLRGSNFFFSFFLVSVLNNYICISLLRGCKVYSAFSLSMYEAQKSF